MQQFIISLRNPKETSNKVMKGIRLLICCIILCIIFPQTVYAEEIISEKPPLDIIFVIDCSGSMKTNDPSKMGLNMVQAFIDTVQTGNIRVGYVAYNEDILSFSAPKSITETKTRETLKEEIGAIAYSGDTDIGLGVSYAYELLSATGNQRQMMVLISDGETDLPKSSERTTEQSNRELAQCVSQCAEENIQIYTVAFGQYNGNKIALEEIASETGAESCSVQSPENLIEVFYGIFRDNLIYEIRQLSSGMYAGGNQEIRYVPDAPYLDEIKVLLISSGSVGKTTVRYGEEEIPLTNLSHYAVGKIENAGIDVGGKELVIRSETDEGQDLQAYVISYRKLMPVLEIQTDAGKNQNQEYQVYFRDRNGQIITDSAFYDTFSWEPVCDSPDAAFNEARVSDGVLKGNLCFSHAGTYKVGAVLADDLGSHTFSASIEVTNTIPAGSIPEKDTHLLEGDRTLCLDDYFTDSDGDALSYSVVDVQEGIDAQLDGSLLTVSPQGAGTYIVAIQVSDGESTIQYAYRIRVLPLWQAYWWLILLAAAVIVIILWRLTHKPKPELERLTEEKKQNHFCGKLDAYFVLQPPENEEIPPLSFQMNKIKDSRVSLGALFGNYPEQAKMLQLEEIFLIADENRSMVLYHRSKSGVMVGNTIACMQIQYSIHFGDIIYITSPDGNYDLEIHYIAAFQ